MASDDLKTNALDSSQDFYALLDLPESAQETEIRRAYRKTALKYHPDKVGANQEALDKFHLLQIAYDVLSDPTIKELYDNARRAKQAKVERDKAYEGRRKWMKEDLERRESGASKRKREEVDAEEEFERELRRLAEDGKRRRKEREEMLRREAREMQDEEQTRENGEIVEAEMTKTKTNGSDEVSEMDRSVTLRFPQNESTKTVDQDEVRRRFERFGPIEDVVLREKKLKIDGQKHRHPYITAVLVYKSVVGAHAAVTDLLEFIKSNPETYSIFEAVSWAAGKEPDFIPSTKPPPPTPEKPVPKQPRVSKLVEQLNTPVENGNGTRLKKVPSFGSFKGTPAKASQNSPSLDEITMIRLKNAERRRMEEKIRREEAAAAEADGDGEVLME